MKNQNTKIPDDITYFASLTILQKPPFSSYTCSCYLLLTSTDLTGMPYARPANRKSPCKRNYPQIFVSCFDAGLSSNCGNHIPPCLGQFSLVFTASEEISSFGRGLSLEIFLDAAIIQERIHFLLCHWFWATSFLYLPSENSEWLYMGKIQSHSYIGTTFESFALLLQIIENAPSAFV